MKYLTADDCRAALSRLHKEIDAGFRSDSPYCDGIFGAYCKDTWRAAVVFDIEEAAAALREFCLCEQVHSA
ncbi:MAG: hypothetical protein LBV49_10840 [Azonexus sp.]|jgi:hypothetical protein|nr:hypothetical protein [Azonexus sp.]